MTKKIIKIQPKERADGTLPYPFFIDEKGLVGRQDFWKGEPFELIGFDTSPSRHKGEIDFKQFWEKPELAIGLYPIFSHKNGEWITYSDPISSIDIRQ